MDLPANNPSKGGVTPRPDSPRPAPPSGQTLAPVGGGRVAALCPPTVPTPAPFVFTQTTALVTMPALLVTTAQAERMVGGGCVLETLRQDFNLRPAWSSPKRKLVWSVQQLQQAVIRLERETVARPIQET